MVKIARFVVETCAHVTTIYKPKVGGLPGELEPFDNTPFTLYDMETYGVDMCIIKSSGTGGTRCGPTNEISMLGSIVDKYPNKFRACCGSNVDSQTRNLKILKGEIKWSLDVAVQDMEAALKTGKFVGMGEFIPRNLNPGHVYSYKERLNEFRRFADLAAKYKVTLDYHELTAHRYPWSPQLLLALAQEYPDVNFVICHGGFSEAYPLDADRQIREACSIVNRVDNVYLECGGWPAEYFKIALENPNVGPTRLMWGYDYGNVPQYLIANPAAKSGPSSYPILLRKNWPAVPQYQTDFWGWSLHQIHKLKDWNWLTQDEINLIMGGNAARLFKLPVPYSRMFPAGRPDLWGVNWEKSISLIPREQILNPDPEDSLPPSDTKIYGESYRRIPPREKG
jgi:predicted TIM-barrel fold metal-dependent hydrolase